MKRAVRTWFVALAALAVVAAACGGDEGSGGGSGATGGGIEPAARRAGTKILGDAHPGAVANVAQMHRGAAFAALRVSLLDEAAEPQPFGCELLDDVLQQPVDRDARGVADGGERRDFSGGCAVGGHLINL